MPMVQQWGRKESFICRAELLAYEPESPQT